MFNKKIVQITFTYNINTNMLEKFSNIYDVVLTVEQAIAKALNTKQFQEIVKTEEIPLSFNTQVYDSQLITYCCAETDATQLDKHEISKYIDDHLAYIMQPVQPTWEEVYEGVDHVERSNIYCIAALGSYKLEVS